MVNRMVTYPSFSLERLHWLVEMSSSPVVFCIIHIDLDALWGSSTSLPAQSMEAIRNAFIFAMCQKDFGK